MFRYWRLDGLSGVQSGGEFPRRNTAKYGQPLNQLQIILPGIGLTTGFDDHPGVLNVCGARICMRQTPYNSRIGNEVGNMNG